MKKFYPLIVLLSINFALTACGFHLHGYEPMPVQLQTLYLQTNTPYNTFTKELTQSLQSAHIRLVQDAINAPLVLQILNEGFTQQVTSSGSGSQTTTYLLIYTVNYQLLNQAGNMVLPKQTITVTRNYSVSANQLLGDTNTQNMLLGDMQRDAIYQMLNRLRMPGTLQALQATR